ncbi:hypothetical protein [Paenibacillus luteus]|uniref:hypothetical protein n=1 Tax=Paenibacillus luteus TaxID=2545753 RepID=UPI001143891C|nr:hypothetical protein [Paenibacillus luteus]
MKEAAEHIIANDLDREAKDYLIGLDIKQLISLHFTLGMYVRNNYEIRIENDDPIFPTHPDNVSFKVIKEIVRKLKLQ